MGSKQHAWETLAKSSSQTFPVYENAQTGIQRHHVVKSLSYLRSNTFKEALIEAAGFIAAASFACSWSCFPGCRSKVEQAAAKY